MMNLQAQLEAVIKKVQEAERAIENASNVKKEQQAEKALARLQWERETIKDEIERHGWDGWYCSHCEKWFSGFDECLEEEYCEDCYEEQVDWMFSR